MNGTLVQRLDGLSPSKRALLEKRFGRSLTRPENQFSITTRHDQSVAALSLNQEGLLFMEQLDPGTSRYNIFDAIRVKGCLDSALIQETLDKIVNRHEALRTVFTDTDGVWRQVIRPPGEAHFRQVSLDSGPIADRELRAFDLVQEEADRPLDLCEGPLFSALLVNVGQLDSILLIKMHHIISDGWSLGVFWNEFSTVYSALIEDTSPRLPGLSIQFGDYSAWSREYLTREIDRQTSYWTEQLRGSPTLLELPTDRPRPAVQTSNGAQEIVTFAPDLLRRINDLCKSEGSTLYMTLLAGFNALLARYTAANDVIVGTPIAGRNRTETENLIGFFVNTLVLRNDLSGDPTFREILSRVRKTVLEAFSHQELPFEKLVAAVRPDRSLSYNPVYQIMFALQDTAGSRIRIPGLNIEALKIKVSASKFDLFLSARQATGGLEITVEYNSDLFDQTTIQRFVLHYKQLLESAVGDPNARLSELAIMDEAERRQILVDWNDTKTPFPDEAVHQLFEARVCKSPDEIALVAEHLEWTYAQLSEWSNRMANYLRNAGAGVDQRIGICMDRSPNMIAAIIGVLKCGASYVPIDPANPPSRLEQIIEDGELSLILTSSEHGASFHGSSVPVIFLDHEHEDIQRFDSTPISEPRCPDDVACVLFTSGSTGKPKGVLIPHRAINRLVINTNYIQLHENDRVAHVSNVAFDLALFEIWGALLNGGRLVILSKDVVLSPQDFASHLRSTGVTAMILATSLFNLVSRERPDAFAALDTLLVAGEAFDPAAGRRVLSSDPPKRLINAYGPTESTTYTTWKEIDEIAPDARSVSIGRPLSNTTVFLLDESLNPVPVGVVGEIYIGGDGLANGYLNRPELTEERFVHVPAQKILASAGDGTPVRLYRTGDLAKYLPTGEIEYIGRQDHQVKIRGYRIELGEIESVIDSHPDIAEAVVLAVRDENDHRMVAFYSLQPDSQIRYEELREYVRERLPNYMVPTSWVYIERFALNGNGKIDRQLLESKAMALPTEGENTSERAIDELEVKLTWIWQKVLGLGAIGVKDNFFDIGGHSLAAVRVFSEIERFLGCRLPLATLFQAPTIKSLSQLIRDGGWRSSWRSLVPVRTGGTKPPFFCIHAVGGNILEYNELAGHLSSDQPFYGLQSIGLDGHAKPLTDIRSMAAAYIREIREVQPHGPYYLGGRSFGGSIAFEIASQLRDEGEDIAMLAIFDSYPKGWLKLYTPDEARDYRRRFLRLRLKRHLQIWLRLGMLDKLRYGAIKIGYKSRKIRNRTRQIFRRVEPASASVQSVLRKIEEINYSAFIGYVPKVYEGKVTFFCADEEVCPEENLTGWRRLAAGGVDVINVPGDHQTMIKQPHVAKLAQSLEEAIQKGVGETSGDQL